MDMLTDDLFDLPLGITKKIHLSGMSPILLSWFLMV